MILDHIARARRMGLAYVYLGYWVRDSRKMDYKGRFLPQERLTADGWTRFETRRASVQPGRRLRSPPPVQTSPRFGANRNASTNTANWISTMQAPVAPST